MSTVLHELTSLMQQPLISIWGYFKIGLKRIQNLCHLPSFLEPDLPQELTMETTDSPDKKIVGANGIPRGCMSLPQGPPLHLLRQYWEPNRLLLGASRQSRWILKQRCDADFEVYSKWIWHSVHLIKYLEALMPNDGHKAQSTKVQAIFTI
jgi:hypothetical protein